MAVEGGRGGIRDVRALERHLKNRLDNLIRNPATDDSGMVTAATEKVVIEEGLRATEKVIALLREHGAMIPTHPRKDRIAPDSHTGLAITILAVARRPLHVRQIVRVMREFYRRRNIKVNTLSSRMAKLSQQERIFTRTARNTYWLVNPRRHEQTKTDITKMQIDSILVEADDDYRLPADSSIEPGDIDYDPPSRPDDSAEDEEEY